MNTIVFGFDPSWRNKILREQLDAVCAECGGTLQIFPEEETVTNLDSAVLFANAEGIDNIVLVVEPSLVNDIDAGLHEDYGDLFESIQVFPEVCSRLREGFDDDAEVSKLKSLSPQERLRLMLCMARAAGSIEWGEFAELASQYPGSVLANEYNYVAKAATANAALAKGNGISSMTGKLQKAGIAGGKDPANYVLEKSFIDTSRAYMAQFIAQAKIDLQNDFGNGSTAEQEAPKGDANGVVRAVVLPFNLPLKGTSTPLASLLSAYKDGIVFVPSTPFDNYQKNDTVGMILTPGALRGLISEAYPSEGRGLSGGNVRVLNIQKADLMIKTIEELASTIPGKKVQVDVPQPLFTLSKEIQKALSKLNAAGTASQGNGADYDRWPNVSGSVAAVDLIKKIATDIESKADNDFDYFMSYAKDVVDEYEDSEKKAKNKPAEGENPQAQPTDKAEDEKKKKKAAEEVKRCQETINHFHIKEHGWIAKLVVYYMNVLSGKIRVGMAGTTDDDKSWELLKAFINPADIESMKAARDNLGLAILEDVARVAKALKKATDDDAKKKEAEGYKKLLSLNEQQRLLYRIGCHASFPNLVTLFDSAPK